MEIFIFLCKVVIDREKLGFVEFLWKFSFWKIKEKFSIGFILKNFFIP